MKDIECKSNYSYNDDYYEKVVATINDLTEQDKKKIFFTTSCLQSQETLNIVGSVLGCTYIGECLSAHVRYEEYNKIWQNLQEQLGMNFSIYTASCSYANFVACLCLAKSGSKILTLHRNHGGHKSMGTEHSLLYGIFEVIYYGLDENEIINYKEIEEKIIAERPSIIILGSSSYSRLIDYERVWAIANQYNVKVIADCAHTIGLMIAQVIPFPKNFAHIITGSNYKSIPGPRGGIIMSSFKEIWAKIDFFIGKTQEEPPLNITMGTLWAIKSCLSLEQKNKLLNSLFMAKTIEKIFKEKGYHIIYGETNNHMVCMDISSQSNWHPMDLVSFLDKYLFVCIGLCSYHKSPSKYGIRLICVNNALINMPMEYIHIVINNIIFVIENKESLTTEKIEQIVQEHQFIASKFSRYKKIS